MRVAAVPHFQNAVSEPREQDCNLERFDVIIEAMPISNRNLAQSPPLADRLRHVRWIVGGTGSGKSTVAAGLARRFRIDVYAGDRAEHDWLARCTPQQHPHLAALRGRRPGDNWRNRSAQEAFEAMAARHGETVGFIVEDLLARPTNHSVLVDYFGVLPRDLAPLLANPAQAAFLVPTHEFRRNALGRRYADPDRARANWGDLDPSKVIETRMHRDALWDTELSEQAVDLGLPLITIDGSRPPGALIDQLADQFQLPRSQRR